MRPNADANQETDKSSKSSIPILDAHNWASWVVSFEALMRKEKLYMFINGNWRKFKKSDVYESLSAKEKLEYDSLKESAMGHILFYINDTYKEKLRDLASPRKAWKALQRLFEGSESQSKHRIFKKLFNLSLDGCENDLEKYMKENKILVRRLKNAGVELPDDVVAFTLLEGLPDSEEFRTIVRILESNDEELTLERVEKQLHLEHLTRKESSGKRKAPDAAALLAAEQKKRMRQQCEYCRGPHPTAKCWHDPKSRHFKPNLARTGVGRDNVTMTDPMQGQTGNSS